MLLQHASLLMERWPQWSVGLARVCWRLVTRITMQLLAGVYELCNRQIMVSVRRESHMRPLHVKSTSEVVWWPYGRLART